MIIYAYTGAACTGGVATDSDDTSLHCATVVLQHPGGPVGFDRASGPDVIKALVQDVVVIERANSPGWFKLEKDALSSRALHAQFRRVATCTAPLPPLLEQLETVSLNRQNAKKNDVLNRHSKPLIPLTPTIFDDWVVPNDLVRARSARWVKDSCRTFVLWSFSDWGLYALILGNSPEEVLEPILRAGHDLNIPTRQVRSESELPAW